MPPQLPVNVSLDEPGFAPNASNNIQPTLRSTSEQAPHWYNLVLDIPLGKDEVMAKNRIA